MKKRLVSIILTVFLVLSMMPFAAFADNAIVCPACGGEVTKKTYHLVGNYWDFYKCNTCGKWAYLSAVAGLKLLSAGDQAIINAADANAILNFAFNNGHLIPAEKAPTGIGRKDLPGFEDEEGTAQVSKEGKLTYVAHPRLALNPNCVSVPYQDFFIDDEYHTDDCKRTGKHQSYCRHYQLSFNYNQYDYDYIVVDALRHTRTYATFNVVYEIQNGVPGTYYVAKGQPLFRYRKSLGAAEQIFYTPKQETMKLPTDSAGYDDYGISRYQPYDFSYTVYSAAKGEAIKARVFRLVVTCDPDDNKITSDTNITITNNTWNGNIYVDSSTNLTYIYPQYTTVNENNETVTNISENPIIYNNETNKYYTYDSVTNNYYYINYEDTPTPTPSPSPDPTETPAPDVTPTPSPTVKPSTPETGDKGDGCDHTGIIALLEEIRDKMVAGFADFTANFNTVIADFQSTVVAGFADISANFTLAIENLNVNIQNIINKKFEDLPEPSPCPSPDPDQPSPSPEPVDPILPETQNLIIPKMNSNTFTDEHGSWVASGSSKYSDVFDFFHAFDRSTSDFWETNASPSYLQIEIPDPENYYIDGYIMRISKFTNRYAKEWTLQGSDDGKTWDDLDKQTAQNLSDLEEHKYPLTLRKAYKYYRVNMSNYASSMCSLSHFNLLGYDAKDVVTPTPTPTDPPTPTTPPTPGGDNPGGSGSGSGSGDNSWNPFKWLTDLLKDLVESILKGIWKLITSIFGFILWLLSLLFKLFPWMPNSGILALCAGVVVVTVIRIIKFITGR